jgi:hypothetical protein
MVLVLEKSEKERLFPFHPLVMEFLQITKDYESKINPEVFYVFLQDIDKADLSPSRFSLPHLRQPFATFLL